MTDQSIRCRPLLEILEARCLPTTWVVAPDGNDQNSGALDSPLGTIQHGLNLAQPGDTVAVRAGIYQEKIVFPRSGTPEAGPIILRGYADERPVLNGTDVVGKHLVLLRNVSHVEVNGLEITGLRHANDGSGVRIVGHGSGIAICDNYIHDLQGKSAMGITVYGTRRLPISDLVIDGNEIADATPAPSEALTLNGNVARFAITNNVVHDVNNIGIDVIGGERDINPYGKVARDGLIRGNTVFNVHASYGGGFAAGIYVDGGRHIVLENNRSHHNDLGIEIGAENLGVLTHGIVVQNNLVHDNAKAGLVFGGFGFFAGRVKFCHFRNNVVYHNDTLSTGFGQLWVQFAQRNVVTSNVFWASANNVLLASDAGNARNRLDANLWYTDSGAPGTFQWNGRAFASFALYQARTGRDAASLFADPLFLDAAGLDFRLQASSPAIDAGSPVSGEFALLDYAGQTRPQGAAPDIGAFEI